jgi:hypothetical protein
MKFSTAANKTLGKKLLKTHVAFWFGEITPVPVPIGAFELMATVTIEVVG